MRERVTRSRSRSGYALRAARWAGVAAGICAGASAAAAPPGAVNLGLACAEPLLEGSLVACAVDEARQGRTDLNGDGDVSDHVLHLYDVASGTTRNLGLAVLQLELAGGRAAFGLREPDEGADLNGDGDLLDTVLHLYDPATDALTNVGLSGSFRLLPEGMLVLAREDADGADRNGDGDATDRVLHVLDPATGTLHDLGFALEFFSFEVAGDRIGFAVAEALQGEDLNGDGDTSDWRVFVYELGSGELRDTGLPCLSLALSRDFVVCPAREQDGQDLNGDGDLLDRVLHAYDLGARTTRNLGIESDVWALLAGDLVAFLRPTPTRVGTRDVLHTLDLRSGRVRNRRLPCHSFFGQGRLLACSVHEDDVRRDLNGDGEQEDSMLHVFDAVTGRISALGLAWQPNMPMGFDGPLFAVVADERTQRGDLNGDGDAFDPGVLALFDARTRATRSLGFALKGFTQELTRGLASLDGERIAFDVSEQGQRLDLNGDGDLEDHVLHLHELARGPTRNLGLACVARMQGGVIACPVTERARDVDLNGDGDALDEVLHVYDLSDADGDGLPDSDERALGTNLDATDSDGDGLLDGEEPALGMDPTRADDDGDGIPDGRDLDSLAHALQRIVTQPPFADADVDGLFDFDEASLGTDPANPDSDGDGVGDGEEPPRCSPSSSAPHRTTGRQPNGTAHASTPRSPGRKAGSRSGRRPRPSLPYSACDGT